MPKATGYHRPGSIEEALAELAAPGTPKVILAGGTTVNAALDREPVEVIDLQALGLDEITSEAGLMRVGATASLAGLATHPATPEVLAQLAVREAPSTLRAAGTVGGLIAAPDPESELLAGLLVHDATVTIVDATGTADHNLSDVLAAGVSGIVTAVTFDTGGTTAVARTARTPADRPIVAAMARNDGATTWVAVCGVAATPVLVDDAGSLDPPGDFRGSSDYRRHLAQVLTARVRAEVGA